MYFPSHHPLPCARQNQRLLRTGNSNIAKSALLLQICRIFRRNTHVARKHAILHADHENDRKFQSLGLVDGQNADRTAGGLGADRLEILALFEHAAQQAHKVKQAAEALSLKRARPLEERQQVALTLCAVRQSAVQTERAGLVVNLPQQAVHRLIARKGAQKVQPLQEGFHLGSAS